MKNRLLNLLFYSKKYGDTEKVVAVEKLINTYQEFNHTPSTFFDYLTNLRKLGIEDETFKKVVKGLWYSHVYGAEVTIAYVQ